jgi:beta-glucosidase-like glycosyl hydrolase
MTPALAHEVGQSIAQEARVVYVDTDRCKSGCVHASCG